MTRTAPRRPDLAEQQTRDQAVNDEVVASFVTSTSSDRYREVMAGLVGHLHGFADGVSCAARVLALPGGDVACVDVLVPLSRLPRGPSRRRSAAATIRAPAACGPGTRGPRWCPSRSRPRLVQLQRPGGIGLEDLRTDLVLDLELREVQPPASAAHAPALVGEGGDHETNLADPRGQRRRRRD
ncbi:MAG: hypothetical protein JWR58_2243 [Pseudonocardia sp.]|nr:hypothetical protein [Pseudonocardia sp.]